MTDKASSPWDYFDRFYCISLREREDRRRSAREEFAKVGLTDRVEFLVVERYSYDVMQQIYESHMMCLQKGLEAGAQSIVVFEDDVEFDGFDPQRLQSCVEFLKQNPRRPSPRAESPLSEFNPRLCLKQRLRANAGLCAVAGNCQ